MQYEWRVRWLTYAESKQLLNELPPHLQEMAEFSLATGLRESNVTGLKWVDVDLKRKHALVHPDQSKTKRAIPVPLNTDQGTTESIKKKSFFSKTKTLLS